MQIMFNEVKVIDFVKAIVECPAEYYTDELQYYFIINDTFYPIQEIFLTVGGVIIKNCEHDIDLEVANDEQGMIWLKNEIE